MPTSKRRIGTSDRRPSNVLMHQGIGYRSKVTKVNHRLFNSYSV